MFDDETKRYWCMNLCTLYRHESGRAAVSFSALFKKARYDSPGRVRATGRFSFLMERVYRLIVYGFIFCCRSLLQLLGGFI
ncbi:hypothetical protein BDV35DRAFT_230242 [Aspergillus flavus]|uniref:Uncharacterized protein n=1 Tax=Aspergillus flavus TaxID=5059 RepID=A0A5N6GWU1_ASPFL|nr:hypothetical protein BDV35DRAFT_230242 [Aspergillus flavus]